MTQRLPLIIVGISGVARESLDIAQASRAAGSVPVAPIAGFIDDHPTERQLERLRAWNTPFLGTVDGWLRRVSEKHEFSIGVAAPDSRQLLAEKLSARGHSPRTLIHPEATIGTHVEIGEGTIVYAGARLTTNINIGRFNIISPNVTVGHDSILRDFVSLNPGANISGDCCIEERVLVGAGATVLQNLSVGHDTVIGARALLTRSAPPEVLVKGIPGRWTTGRAPSYESDSQL